MICKPNEWTCSFIVRGPAGTSTSEEVYIFIYIYIYIFIYKWRVCLGSYILEQDESRDVRKRAGGEGKEEGMELVSWLGR